MGGGAGTSGTASACGGAAGAGFVGTVTGTGQSGGDVDDLIHLRGPLTEDAVVRALQARFYQHKFYVRIYKLHSKTLYDTKCFINCIKIKYVKLKTAPELYDMNIDSVKADKTKQ